MGLLHRTPAVPALPPGILGSRRLAAAGLLRLFSRARRHARPLLLLRLEGHGRAPAALPPLLLQALAAQVRIGDLLWVEPGAGLFLLLEDASEPEALLQRLLPQARQQGEELSGHAARFPRAGLTLEALLQEVAWRP